LIVVGPKQAHASRRFLGVVGLVEHVGVGDHLLVGPRHRDSHLPPHGVGDERRSALGVEAQGGLTHGALGVGAGAAGPQRLGGGVSRGGGEAAGEHPPRDEGPHPSDDLLGGGALGAGLVVSVRDLLQLGLDEGGEQDGGYRRGGLR